MFVNEGDRMNKYVCIATQAIVVIISCFFISDFLAHITTNMETQCVEPDSFDRKTCMNWKKIQKKFSPSLANPEFPLYNIPEYPEATSFNPIFKGKKYNDLVIVTSSTPGYFPRLRNLIGSIHFWEPKLKIVVYDMGLTPELIDEVMTWKNVELKEFDFSKYPPYVSLVWNFAWKLFMIEEEMKNHPAICWLDSGVELRHPLVSMRYFLERDGFFSTTMEKRQHITGRTTMQETFDKMKDYGIEELEHFDEETIKKGPYCSGYIMAFDHRDTSKSILEYGFKCARDEACISPKEAHSDNHNFDQSAITIAAYANGLVHACEHENISIDTGSYEEATFDETRCNHFEIAARRTLQSGPYIQHIKKKKSSAIRKSTPKNYKPKVIVERRQRIGSIKTITTKKYDACVDNCKSANKNAGDKFQRCLQKCNDDARDILEISIQKFKKWFVSNQRIVEIYFKKSGQCDVVKRKSSILRVSLLMVVSTIYYVRTHPIYNKYVKVN